MGEEGAIASAELRRRLWGISLGSLVEEGSRSQADAQSTSGGGASGLGSGAPLPTVRELGRQRRPPVLPAAPHVFVATMVLRLVASPLHMAAIGVHISGIQKGSAAG